MGFAIHCENSLENEDSDDQSGLLFGNRLIRRI